MSTCSDRKGAILDAPCEAARLAGKRAFITGGGSGIGAAIARRFRTEGAAVVVADIAGGDVQCDVRSRDSVETAIEEAAGLLGGLDTLVLNAGRPIVGALHELAERQMSSFGGMVSFVVDGGLEGARNVLRRVTVFALAESLGGVESLIGQPALMSHASMPRDVREARGVKDGLIPISVGP